MEKIISFPIDNNTYHIYLLKDNKISVRLGNRVLFYLKWPANVQLGKQIDKVVLETIIGKIYELITKK